MILLIDDNAWVGDTYVPLLQDMLHHEVRFLLHAQQQEQELIAGILAMEAQYLLLDAQLADGMYGPRLLHLLLRANPSLRCIGFSSDASYAQEFLEAGAVGFVHKRREQAIRSVREVGAIMGVS